ncbi:MAG: hypothetical protein Q4D63_06395 [Neisseria animaloris]|nr:hypothetical protein [Neisseria animaloris]
MRKFKHVYGLNGQFVKLENRPYWLQVNDAEYHPDHAVSTAFGLTGENLYALEGDMPPLKLPGNVLTFSKEADAIERKKLEAAALAEIAKNLSAAQAEYELEKLIESIEYYLKQDDLFK